MKFTEFYHMVVFALWLSLTIFVEIFTKSVSSSNLVKRQVIPQNPTYIVLSTGVYEDYTLLRLANDSRTIVTAGVANQYNFNRPPPDYVLRGNRGIRRPFESWSIGTLNTRERCLRPSLERPYLTLARCQNGTLSDRSIKGDTPGPSDSWGLSQDQPFRTNGQPVLFSPTQGSHITVIYYTNDGLVSNETVGF
ncbi:hypothetical protein BY996DRAFT_6408635 [Phakopsora pachyrhizi]|nr:hypothetical protein BY996DRAFT_6408635 [Phakopsora pachyrhizi]